MNPTSNDPRTYAVIGAAMEVHRCLGGGFAETVYQEAMEIELTIRAIPFRPQLDVPVFYKGQQLRVVYRPDFLCYDSVLVELKALSKMGGTEDAQIINYLKATRLETGLLLNFGPSSLEYKRFINSATTSP